MNVLTGIDPGGIMKTVAEMLHEFHTRPGCDIGAPTYPTMDVTGLDQRLAFIEEEVLELRDAYEAGDLTKFADGLGDIIYAVYGTAWRTGIPMDDVVAEIHFSNMTKIASPGDGKAIKGPGYVPPNVAAALRGIVSGSSR